MLQRGDRRRLRCGGVVGPRPAGLGLPEDQLPGRRRWAHPAEGGDDAGCTEAWRGIAGLVTTQLRPLRDRGVPRQSIQIAFGGGSRDSQYSQSATCVLTSPEGLGGLFSHPEPQSSLTILTFVPCSSGRSPAGPRLQALAPIRRHSARPTSRGWACSRPHLEAPARGISGDAGAAGIGPRRGEHFLSTRVSTRIPAFSGEHCLSTF